MRDMFRSSLSIAGYTAVIGMLVAFTGAAAGALPQQVPANAPNLSDAEAKALKTPIPFTNT